MLLLKFSGVNENNIELAHEKKGGCTQKPLTVLLAAAQIVFQHKGGRMAAQIHGWL